MGSEFLERNKRKSALAALWLFLGGRGKYLAVLFVAGLVSTPFLVSQERLNSVLAFPGVAAALRMVGLGGLVSEVSVNAPDMLAAAGSAGAGGANASARASFWEKYLRAANAPLPPAGATSTMAMLRGGADLIGPAVIEDKPGTKPAGPDKVKGSVNAEDRARGEGAGGVDLEAILAGAGGEGGYGDLMGQHLGDRQGGGAGPYANRAMMGGPGSVADRAEGAHNQVMKKAAEGVPVPGSPKKLNSKMGRVSGFAWKNMGRKSARSGAVARANSRKAMYHLSRAFSMGAVAFGSTVPEYESTYSGVTFDGIDAGADMLLAGESVAPTVPNVAFAMGLITDVSGLLDDAAACAAAGANQGERMGAIGAEMKRIQDTMDTDDPPGCCFWDTDWWGNWFRSDPDADSRQSWNAKVDNLFNLCNELNTNAHELSAACPSVSVTRDMECASYTDMKIECEWYSCLVEIIVWALTAAILGIFLVLWAGGAFGGDGPGAFVRGVTNWILGNEPAEPPANPQTEGIEKVD